MSQTTNRTSTRPLPLRESSASNTPASSSARSATRQSKHASEKPNARPPSVLNRILRNSVIHSPQLEWAPSSTNGSTISRNGNAKGQQSYNGVKRASRMAPPPPVHLPRADSSTNGRRGSVFAQVGGQENVRPSYTNKTQDSTVVIPNVVLHPPVEDSVGPMRLYPPPPPPQLRRPPSVILREASARPSSVASIRSTSEAPKNVWGGLAGSFGGPAPVFKRQGAKRVSMGVIMPMKKEDMIKERERRMSRNEDIMQWRVGSSDSEAELPVETPSLMESLVEEPSSPPHAPMQIRHRYSTPELRRSSMIDRPIQFTTLRSKSQGGSENPVDAATLPPRSASLGLKPIDLHAPFRTGMFDNTSNLFNNANVGHQESPHTPVVALGLRTGPAARSSSVPIELMSPVSTLPTTTTATSSTSTAPALELSSEGSFAADIHSSALPPGLETPSKRKSRSMSLTAIAAPKVSEPAPTQPMMSVKEGERVIRKHKSLKDLFSFRIESAKQQDPMPKLPKKVLKEQEKADLSASTVSTKPVVKAQVTPQSSAGGPKGLTNRFSISNMSAAFKRSKKDPVGQNAKTPESTQTAQSEAREHEVGAPSMSTPESSREDTVNTTSPSTVDRNINTSSALPALATSNEHRDSIETLQDILEAVPVIRQRTIVNCDSTSSRRSLQAIVISSPPSRQLPSPPSTTMDSIPAETDAEVTIAERRGSEGSTESSGYYTTQTSDSVSLQCSSETSLDSMDSLSPSSESETVDGNSLPVTPCSPPGESFLSPLPVPAITTKVEREPTEMKSNGVKGKKEDNRMVFPLPPVAEEENGSVYGGIEGDLQLRALYFESLRLEFAEEPVRG